MKKVKEKKRMLGKSCRMGVFVTGETKEFKETGAGLARAPKEFGGKKPMSYGSAEKS